MRINRTNNTNFSGYKNLIAYEQRQSTKKVALISMQLTNVGDKTLDMWHDVQKGLWKRTNLKDTINIVNIDYNNSNFFVVDDKVFKAYNKKIDFSEKEEPYIFKLFTSLAHITKDIMQGHCAPLDKDVIDVVLCDFVNNMSKMMPSSYQVMNFALQCLDYTSKDAKQSATMVNNGIDKMMRERLDL